MRADRQGSRRIAADWSIGYSSWSTLLNLENCLSAKSLISAKSHKCKIASSAQYRNYQQKSRKHRSNIQMMLLAQSRHAT